jgi:hypothetical protein
LEDVPFSYNPRPLIVLKSAFGKEGQMTWYNSGNVVKTMPEAELK